MKYMKYNYWTAKTPRTRRVDFGFLPDRVIDQVKEHILLAALFFQVIYHPFYTVFHKYYIPV